MPTPIPTPNAKDRPERPVVVTPLISCQRRDGETLDVELRSLGGKTCVKLSTRDTWQGTKGSVVVHRDEIVFLIHALESAAIELGISNLGDF